jgi:hypothetical protein
MGLFIKHPGDSRKGRAAGIRSLADSLKPEFIKNFLKKSQAARDASLQSYISRVK